MKYVRFSDFEWGFSFMVIFLNTYHEKFDTKSWKDSVPPLRRANVHIAPKNDLFLSRNEEHYHKSLFFRIFII